MVSVLSRAFNAATVFEKDGKGQIVLFQCSLEPLTLQRERHAEICHSRRVSVLSRAFNAATYTNLIYGAVSTIVSVLSRAFNAATRGKCFYSQPLPRFSALSSL